MPAGINTADCRCRCEGCRRKTTDRIAGRTAPAGLRRMPCLTGPPRYRSSRLGTLGTAARCACFGGQTLAKSQVMAQVRKRRRQRVARSGHAGKNACGSCRRHGVRAAAVSASSQKNARCLASRPAFSKHRSRDLRWTTTEAF